MTGRSFGSITVTVLEPEPYSARQIELLKTFADQAVIAIRERGAYSPSSRAATTNSARPSNGRRLTARHPASNQSGADRYTAGVRRPSRTAPCGCSARGARAFRQEGASVLRLAAVRGGKPEEVRPSSSSCRRRGAPNRTPGRTVSTRTIQHIVDIENSPVSAASPPLQCPGTRLALCPIQVPMLRGDHVLGGDLGKRAGSPDLFASEEMVLLQTFADEVVIAVRKRAALERAAGAYGRSPVLGSGSSPRSARSVMRRPRCSDPRNGAHDDRHPLCAALGPRRRRRLRVRRGDRGVRAAGIDRPGGACLGASLRAHPQGGVRSWAHGHHPRAGAGARHHAGPAPTRAGLRETLVESGIRAPLAVPMPVEAT